MLYNQKLIFNLLKFYNFRENRRKKRIEKEIKKMEKIGRKLKPIEELEPNRVIVKQIE